MPLSKLAFKPGINREGTNYSNEGGWHDGDKIRFRYGYVEKLGGWEKATTEAYSGTPRILHDFVTLSSQSLLFIGTENKTYLEESGTLYDITPYRRTVLFPQTVTGTEATSGLGTVLVAIGGSTDDNIATPKGVAAFGIAGRLASVVGIDNIPFGFEAQGQVGVVNVIAEPVDVVVAGISGVTVSPITYEATGEVGTVSVDAFVPDPEE